MTPVFELNHLQVSLRGKKRNTDLVKGVFFSVKQGECLGILGESGSGKSMSIKAAMGLLDKNFVVSGSAKFQGDELVGKNAEQLRRLRGGQVGIVLQNPMTCFDPLYRIMIGIAMSMEPSLLIADEPTTAIDAITQFDILNEFAVIKQKHKTAMIFISHDLNAVSQIADKIVVLNQGQVVDQGDFHHIIHHAADPYTRLLIEKRTDVMRKYRQALEGGECSHAQAG